MTSQPSHPHRPLTICVAVAAVVITLSGPSSAIAGDVTPWRNLHTPLADSSGRASPYVISLDPTGTRLLAAQWVVRNCVRRLRIAEYHHGRWHGPTTVVRQRSRACLWVPGIDQILQSASGRTVVIVGNPSNGDDYTLSAAVRYRGRWSRVRTLGNGIGDLQPPWAVARNGSVALTATHPMAEGGPLDVVRWQRGRWSTHRVLPSIDWSQKVAVSPHGTTQWIAYSEQTDPRLRLAVSTAGTWRNVVAFPGAGSWQPLAMTLASGGNGSILAANHNGISPDDPGPLVVATCGTVCGPARVIHGSTGEPVRAWVSADGRSARWVVTSQVGTTSTKNVSQWTWRRGRPARIQRTLPRLGQEASVGSAISSDGRGVALGWRDESYRDPTKSVMVTTRWRDGRWHDQRLRDCQRFQPWGDFAHRIAAENGTAVITVQCHGSRRTYAYGLP